ncbi:carbohydrate porin [Bradyrhizobium sp. ISRA443]|uniref:carbohydrate porin n=1 Tax=unclassified Bradyrhizobium TaxID=2631580 RepID=UPI00247AB0F2|nr:MULTISPECIES: carbohydrate porin [unclassified Bradyrhizobium]WGR97883.1 carbohydrate porin [Bradyrhizobium sp. ISRA436]WGS04773.1 carbohydrate porin [Bradyrhizobium sp. ISRA437]WGS11654.1 carbohydrate porin [Bradyrhizobium sp. ISRA443]
MNRIKPADARVGHGIRALSLTGLSRSVSNFRRNRQSGSLLALSLAASLVGGPAPAQTVSTSSHSSNPDQVGRKNPGNKVGSRFRKGADSFRAAMIASERTTAVFQRAGTLPPREADPYAKFEKLRERGLVVSIPGPADTITQDEGGVRSALAEVGIGYVGWTQYLFVDNVLPNAARSTIANQLYSGQNPTYYTQNFLMVTYDLSQFGIPDGQIIVGTEQQSWNWQPGGPDRWGINEIAYYQTLFDRKVELKMGYLRNNYEFAGTVVGGNAGSSVFGSSSNILYEGGLSSNQTPTPAINLTYHFDDQLYTKSTLQRAISPDGSYTQTIQNSTGLNWSMPNAGLLFLDETGYRNKAAPGVSDTWLRAGAGFNDSKYTSLAYPTQPRDNGNSFYYLAADRQLWQVDPQGAPGRGIYAGFSVMSAPSDINKVSQYGELRVYAKGFFDSRPRDQISIVVTDTVWSKLAVNAALAKGNLVHWDSKAISGTYTAHLAPGIYLNLGLSYINNPTSITYTPQTGHALNFSAATTIAF